MTKQDPRKFIYSSDYPMAYFVYNNKQTLVLPNGQSGVKKIEHEQPFIPMVIGYWSSDADFSSYHNFGENPEGDAYYGVTITVEADGNDIIINWENTSNDYQTVYIKIWAYIPPDSEEHANTVSDDTDFMLDTDFPYLEIAQAGTVDYGQPTSIQHGLGYVPMCRIWRKYSYNGTTYIEPDTEAIIDEDGNGTPWVDEDQLKIGAGYSNTICHYYHIYTSEG